MRERDAALRGTPCRSDTGTSTFAASASWRLASQSAASAIAAQFTTASLSAAAMLAMPGAFASKPSCLEYRRGCMPRGLQPEVEPSAELAGRRLSRTLIPFAPSR